MPANADPYLPDPGHAHRRLDLVCRLMAAICFAMILGVVGYVALVTAMAASMPGLGSAEVSYEVLLAMGAIWIAGEAALVWGLWSGRRCFAGLARGRFFDPTVISGLRNFAAGLFLYKASYAGMLLAAVTGSHFQGFALPEGTGVTNMDLGEAFFTLASLGAVWIIAVVLAHASDIADDNAQIV